MRSVNRITLLSVILLTGQIFTNDTSKILSDFSFRSDITAASARSMIIHYFQSGHYDSIDLVIDYCDTLSTMNTDWLSGHERIIIALLKGNLRLLRNPMFYRKHISLHDSIPKESLYQKPPAYDIHRHNMPSHDNLSPFLWQNYQKKIIMFKARHPKDEYLWDFLDIVFDRTDKKVIRYLVNYPDSPFTKFVRYNYFVRYEYRHHGAIFGAGTSLMNLDKETNLLLKDRGALLAFIDAYVWGISINTSLSLAIKRSQDSMLVNNDTIPAATPFRDIFFDITIGPLISFKDLVYFTPYLGGGGFYTSPYYYKDVSFPVAWGVKTGISTDLRLAFYKTNFITSLPKPDLAFRLDMGYQYNKFYRIRGELGKHVFYLNLAIELICFKFERIYEVD